MKKLFFLMVMLTTTALGASAQTKLDGTPDMRYKANRELYGSSYSTPSYYSPSYTQPRRERNYDNGGQLRLQNGYMKSNGTYVDPHLKTTPDNSRWNNLSNWDLDR